MTRTGPGVGAALGLAAWLATALPVGPTGALAAAGAPRQEEAGAREAYERGEAALRRGDLEEAVAAYREALAASPGDPDVLFRLGHALHLAGESGALEFLERARDATGGRPDVHFVLAQAYLRAGRHQDAAGSLEVAEASAPAVPTVHLVRGELCHAVGRLDAAERHLRQALEMAGEWARPLFDLGLIAVARGRWEEAVTWLERSVEAEPRDPEAWLLLATARSRAGDPAGSTEAMEQAVAAAPDLVMPRLVLAERYDFLDRVPDLVEQAEAILERDPDNPTALMHLASRAALEGRVEEALELLDRLLDADRSELDLGLPAPVPTAGTGRRSGGSLFAEARRLRADLLRRSGRLDDAVAVARELVREAPWFPDGHFLLGNLLLRQGNPEGRTHLERFKRLSDARQRRRMGEGFLETSDDPALAEREFEAALEAWPDDRRAKLGLARVRRMQGRPEEAVGLLREARGAPGAVDAWHTEAILALEAAGRREDALDTWGQARSAGLTLGPEVWAVVHDGEYGCRRP